MVFAAKLSVFLVAHRDSRLHLPPLFRHAGATSCDVAIHWGHAVAFSIFRARFAFRHLPIDDIGCANLYLRFIRVPPVSPSSLAGR